MGSTGYFRKFLPNYAKIAKPLSDLLKKNEKFKFNDRETKAVNSLKAALSREPVLKIFTRGAETELHTDASKEGYGAVLLQRCVEDNELHPIHYMSRKTTPAEQNYCSYELEVLAIIEVVKKFRIYLLRQKFKIVTDCNSLKRQ